MYSGDESIQECAEVKGRGNGQLVIPMMVVRIIRNRRWHGRKQREPILCSNYLTINQSRIIVDNIILACRGDRKAMSIDLESSDRALSIDCSLKVKYPCFVQVLN